MSGVVLNVLTILVGTLVGLTVGRLIKDRFHEIVFQAMGFATMAFGIYMTVGGLGDMAESKMGDYSLLVFVGAMVVGSLCGEALNIERWLERFGNWIQRLVYRVPWFSPSSTSSHSIVDAFMTASLLFCVGAMTVLGSIQDGLGDHSTLYLKSTLDGFASVVLAASFGPGVGFAVLPVIVIQGSIALWAHSFTRIFTPSVVASITATGGMLIVVIALDMLKIKKVRVANMLPAILFAAIIGGLIG